MARAVRHAFGWSLALVAGAVWGVAFFSWGLPLPISVRVVATVLLLAALTVASRAGLLAASAFAVGMSGSSGLLVASTGQLLEWWTLVPACALAAGLLLLLVAMRP